MKLKRVLMYRTALALLCGTCLPGTAWAETDFTETRTTYGDIGILEMPNARMASDGQLSFNLTIRPDTQRYSFAFQVLPWLEGSFRYSHIPKFLNQKNYYDRSFGMKLRLFEEDGYLPDISLGVRDILGTGIYGSEYLVASKRIWQFDVTAGIGWGRLSQRAAFENPFALVFDSFKARPAVGSNGTGRVDFGQFFHGENVGAFGGISWATPIDGLDFQLEYSSDKYDIEKAFGAGPKIRSPFDLGLSYQVFSSMTASAGWYYGSTWGATFSFNLDPTHGQPVVLSAPLPAPVIRSDQEQARAIAQLVLPSYGLTNLTNGGPAAQNANYSLTSAFMNERGVRNVEIDGDILMVDARADGREDALCARLDQAAQTAGAAISTIAVMDYRDPQGRVAVCPQPKITLASAGSGQIALGGRLAPDSPDIERASSARIQDDLAKQAIRTMALSFHKGELWLYYENTHYFSEATAAGRIARILMADAPPDVEIFRLVSVKYGIAMRTIEIARSALERVAKAGSNQGTDVATLELPSMDNPLLSARESSIYPRFHWSISPLFRGSTFDPNAPLQVQVLADVQASVEVLPGLSFNADFDRNLLNDFRSQASNSALPHVRSDIAQYLKKGINALTELSATYRTRIAPDIFTEFKVGYLESMYAGAGAQILWRPDGSRVSFGADVYEVKKRGFDQLLDLQSYHVLTGHVSVYYESPYHGLDFAVHAGRYLAGDYGATFEVTRRFSTGIEVGAFATFTNVPFSKFGEGSFDKGIVLRIPLEWALPVYSQSVNGFILRSLTRDGGQRVEDDDSLFEETRATSYGEITRDINDLTPF